MRRLGFLFAVGAAALLLIAIGVFAAVGFAGLSLYLCLATKMTAPLAALVTAGAALVFMLVVALVAGLAMRRWRRRNPIAALFDTLLAGRALGEEGRGVLAGRLSKATMAMLGLGFAIGLSPRLRRILVDLLLR